MAQDLNTFYKIYLKYLSIFKSKIKAQYIDKLFSDDIEKRIELKSKHTISGGEPEQLTEDIIREMLRECEINPLEISRSIRIKGKDYSKLLTKIENTKKKTLATKIRKPDFLLESSDPDTHNMLFEIEHLNKPLDKTGDGEGLEQAMNWFNIDRGLINECDAIVTNFIDWWRIKYNFEKRDFDIRQFEPQVMLEIIKNMKLGRGRKYIPEEQEQDKREITTQFYNKFQDRLKKLLGTPSKMEIDIKIMNFEKPLEMPQKEFESLQINYYRKVFTRLLFIKIIVSWKRLRVDPISGGVLEVSKRYWPFELKNLFFEVFNKKKEKRSKDIMKIFKDLPYLNGGLFRPNGIEIDNVGNLTDVYLNAEAIEDIWNFFKGFKFVQKTLGKDYRTPHSSNTIRPEILGYILERTIGDERKKTGTYYTPEEITYYISKNTIVPFVVQKINAKFPEMLPIKMYEDIENLANKQEVYFYILTELLPDIKICDPACGSGAFLEKAANILMYLYDKAYIGCGRLFKYQLKKGDTPDSQMPFPDKLSLKKHILQNNLYGVDININAIEICELRLWLWALKLPESISETTKYFDLPALPNIEYNIRVGNSLIGHYKTERLSELGTSKFHRIDEKYLSKEGSTIIDILNKKQDLISCYYQKDENIEESKKKQIREEINSIVSRIKDLLNDLLLRDFQNQKIVVPVEPIIAKDYVTKQNYKKSLHDSIRKINIENEVIYFKINFRVPLEKKIEEVQEVKGLNCSTNKLKQITSIYSTSAIDFKYYSEYGEHTLSKFILRLVRDWNEVDNIEFRKLMSKKDINLINPFHWVMEFFEIFNNQSVQNKGFDIIIGNPPFIRIEKIEKLEKNLYKNIYQLAEKRFDLFILFYELCKSLLKDTGFLCLVSSNKFIKSQTAENMRKFIKSNFSIREILNFNNYNAFPGVAIKTLLLFLVKTKKQVTFPYISINDDHFKLTSSIMHLIENHKTTEKMLDSFSIYQIEGANLGPINWEFSPKFVQNLVEKIESNDIIKLEDLIQSNRQGVVTSANKVFIVGKDVIEAYQIEPEFVYKIVKGKEIRRWRKISWNDKYLIYPYLYDAETKTRKKIKLSESKTKNITKYLLEKKVQLKDRYCVKSGNKKWFELHDPVSPSYFLSKKIMFPDISLEPSFSIDLVGDLFSLDTNYSIILKDENHLFFLLAILNSYVLEIYIKYKFQTLAKERRFKTFLVNDLPIINPMNIETTVFNDITNLSKNLFNTYNKRKENELNLMIRNLYGLNQEEYSYILKDLISKS
ncbi:hypothetical protein LCGC14_1249290 [marine sediment metagenome]|uniref:site-specific DNA-methyltransferase (adenine-specific) n=1 Tax=marine sediment metagenome TaxID=412755 RepID=A0A0F9L7E1_9ZZZZ